ncbi:GDSL esterase/lipase At1g28640-like precursor [Zea mays]|uniref:GDSL esterase/lipase n=2 Tax=Zea mays TaxID=4577 RepID=B4FA08_MAIZE|nr:GDSL esterase/lipase At1g28640-like precursor [Zea mays]ACF78951.1 unknown [Zea mays]ACF85590.1 unknown [Zea mays]ACN27749.1 unknown [Zea mays]ONM06671.1 GDSL esterase/lipase [Zea mays]|eukprot:NP_001130647.1 uncharacterized protein LOC100191748 precursor [Zea mays]
MAPFPRRLPAAVPLLLLLGAAVASAGAEDTDGGNSRRRHSRLLFAFGNSLTDTGNGAIFPVTAGGPFTRPPYGETFFGRPSGRACNGRLVLDFLVEELKVPEPTPYLAGSTAADFAKNGANFALGGATALDQAFLASKGIKSFVPISLINETSWFQNVSKLLDASHYDERKIMAKSIFYVGEIGVNDYFAALSNNDSVDVAVSLVPHIIDTIRSALTVMIDAGARTVVITGMLPIGCEPQQLAQFAGGPAGDYDPTTGCITRFNQLAEHHNHMLRMMLRELRTKYRRRRPLTLHYADIYRPVIEAVASPASYGFGDTPLAACCGGGGGPNNFNFIAFCGTPASTTCTDPSKFVSWDGIHFTEATNRLLARKMLQELLSRGAYNVAI